MSLSVAGLPTSTLGHPVLIMLWSLPWLQPGCQQATTGHRRSSGCLASRSLVRELACRSGGTGRRLPVPCHAAQGRPTATRTAYACMRSRRRRLAWTCTAACLLLYTACQCHVLLRYCIAHTDYDDDGDSNDDLPRTATRLAASARKDDEN
jgi:hypothetical protein